MKAAVKEHCFIFYSMMLGRTVVQSDFILKRSEVSEVTK
jgi:hypothetical protein